MRVRFLPGALRVGSHMSTRMNLYVMIGAEAGPQLPPDWDDQSARTYELDPYRDRSNHRAGRIVVVEDGMCGKYRYAGVLLADPWRDVDPGDLRVAIPAADLPMLIEQARERLRWELRVEVEPQLLVFTHWY